MLLYYNTRHKEFYFVDETLDDMASALLKLIKNSMLKGFPLFGNDVILVNEYESMQDAELEVKKFKKDIIKELYLKEISR